MARDPDPHGAEPLVEGRDYLVEAGLLVFTADWLRRRGTCCESGCRHCPYGFRAPSPPPGGGGAPRSGA